MKNSKRLTYLIPIVIMYLILDYFNILKRIGIDIKNINLELFNVFIVIVLYVTTFYFIDYKQIEKENNKIEISKVIFKNIYEECLNNIEIYNDKIINDYIIPKCDFNKVLFEDRFMYNLLYQPFQDEDMIFALLRGGIIPKNIYEDYLKSKNNYISYLNTRIIFYDKPELSMEKKENVISILEKSLESLNN